MSRSELHYQGNKTQNANSLPYLNAGSRSTDWATSLPRRTKALPTDQLPPLCLKQRLRCSAWCWADPKDHAVRQLEAVGHPPPRQGAQTSHRSKCRDQPTRLPTLTSWPSHRLQGAGLTKSPRSSMAASNALKDAPGAAAVVATVGANPNELSPWPVLPRDG
jgi:hypothetical protein